MGTLQATLPDGVVVEREISRADRYGHGLAMKRGSKWILVSVHMSHNAAWANGRRLARSLGLDGVLGRSVDVIPLSLKIVQQSESVDGSQMSTMVRLPQ